MTNTQSATNPAYKKILLSDNNSLSYTDEGAGIQTILFIHGLATYSGTWHQNTTPLSKHFRCIAIDLPGNGFSDKADQEYSIEYYALCIADFITKMKLENLSICGHSMGGQIALYLLIKHPSIAKKLILCAPAGFEQFNFFEKTMYRSAIGFFDMISSEENSMRSSIYNSFYKNPAQADSLIKELAEVIKTYPVNGYKKMLDASIQSMMHDSVFEHLAEVKCPTLVIFGELDALIPNKLIHPISTEQLAKNAIAKMPNARLEMIPYTGHFVQWEAAEKVNELISQFVAQNA